MERQENRMAKDAYEIAAAQDEMPFTSKELAEEIIPLLQSYFIVEATNSGTSICMRFYNGQQFRVEIEAMDD